MHGLGRLPPWETARVYFSITAMLCGPCRMSLQLQSYGTEPEEPGCGTKKHWRHRSSRLVSGFSSWFGGVWIRSGLSEEQ